jgi:hypothetical protein
MKVFALRGVCVGVDRHLKAGDIVDLESALVTYLVSIGAVEIVHEEPVREPVHIAPIVDKAVVKPTPEKSGKPEK